MTGKNKYKETVDYSSSDKYLKWVPKSSAMSANTWNLGNLPRYHLYSDPVIPILRAWSPNAPC